MRPKVIDPVATIAQTIENTVVSPVSAPINWGENDIKAH